MEGTNRVERGGDRGDTPLDYRRVIAPSEAAEVERTKTPIILRMPMLPDQ